MKAIKNNPEIWKNELLHLHKNINKYDRGHLVVLGGADMTGAARLASEAAMRLGCGLCTIVSSADVKSIYLSAAPHIMFESYKALYDFPLHLSDQRRTGCIVGPGAGRKSEGELRQAVLGVLRLKKPVILDADALNVFEDKVEELSSALHSECVLTPHEGEFARLFPELNGSREERAWQAAQMTGAVIFLKGKETIVCTPTGEMFVNHHSTPYLATAGSGDVLAGMIGSLLVQGMKPHMACAAAAWIHGDAAIQFGAGLTAPDIIQGIPGVLNSGLANGG